MSAVYDIHTHDFPEVPRTSIVQLTPARYCLYPDHVYSVGLHPWDIEDDWRVQMAKVAVIAMHPHVLAIGEAGLDKKKSPAPMDVQKAVFREHVKLSEMLHKPLIVHCVKDVSLGLEYNTDTLLDMPFKYLLLESDTHGDVNVLYKLVSEDMEANEQSVRSLVAKNILAFLKSHYEPSFE